MELIGAAAPTVHPAGLTVRSIDLHVGGQPIRAIGVADPSEVDAGLPRGCVELLCAAPRGRASDVIVLYAQQRNGFYARFSDAAGPIDMCGEGLVALATLACMAGHVSGDEPLVVDTAHGPVQVRASDIHGTASVRLPPARIMERLTVANASGSGVAVTVVNGAGNIFAILDAAHWGLDFDTASRSDLQAAGLAVRAELQRQRGLGAPTMIEFAEFNTLSLSRNVVVWGAEPNLDFGPCGTGSAARAALLHASGRLPVGSSFVSRGLSGQSMHVTVVECCATQQCDEVIVELTATAYLTGQSDHYFVADDELLGRSAIPSLVAQSA